MINNAFGYNLKTLDKICISGMFIALTVILQKVVAINYIPIFTSFSPSDLLGYLIFDPKTYGLFPQITAIYAVLGFVTYYIFWAFKKIKNTKVSMIVLIALLLSLAVGSSLYFILNDQITLYSSTYVMETWVKIALPITIFALIGLLFVILLLLKKFKVDQDLSINVWQISIASFLIEIIVMVLFGSLMKSWAFNFNFFVIAICQIVVLFINVPLNTFLISTFMRLTKRFKK